MSDVTLQIKPFDISVIHKIVSLPTEDGHPRFELVDWLSAY